MTMLKRVCSIIVAMCIVFSSVSTANAFISETADLFINAADGALQIDDEKLAKEIISKLSDNKEKQKLKEYIEKTRPIILDKSNFFNKMLSPAFIWITKKSPSVGNMLAQGVLSAYIMHFERSLEDDDSEIVKKFAELREHNIDAGKDLFVLYVDIVIAPRDKNESTSSLVTDGTLMAMNGKMLNDRYTSSAAAIAKVLEAAGIDMCPEDVGDICNNDYKGSNNNKVTKSSNDEVTGNKSNSAPSSANKNDSTSSDNASLGGVNLGDSIELTNRNLGEAIKKTTKEGNKLRYEYPTMDVAFDYGKVIGIAADDKNVKTTKGLHAGSSLQDVWNNYGKDYMLSNYDNLDLYEYEYKDKSGKDYILRFAVQQGSGVVKYISIRYAE